MVAQKSDIFVAQKYTFCTHINYMISILNFSSLQLPFDSEKVLRNDAVNTVVVALCTTIKSSLRST